MSESTLRVRAANGRSYTAHITATGSAYVYALGHRVYGTIGSLVGDGIGGYNRPFTAKGKYAFIVAAPVAETISV